PPLTNTTQVENTGNVDFESTHTLTVKDVFGNVKYRSVTANDVYPGTIRETVFEWEDATWFGLYKVEMQTEFLEESETHEKFVLIMPRWLIVVFVIALIGGGYVLFRRPR